MGVVFDVFYTQVTPSSTAYFLLPAYQHVSAPSLTARLPAHFHAPHHDDGGLNI